MSSKQETNSQKLSGWTTETELVREFENPDEIAQNVCLAVEEAIEEWPELSPTPPLDQFVEVERLDELFGAETTDGSTWLPSVTFQYQRCRVTVLYGSTVRVIVERDP